MGLIRAVKGVVIGQLLVSVIALGLVYGANSLRIEIMPLLASLGIGGVALAFAAQDTIGNFFGSITVLFDRPFGIGDWIGGKCDPCARWTRTCPSASGYTW